MECPNPNPNPNPSSRADLGIESAALTDYSLLLEFETEDSLSLDLPRSLAEHIKADAQEMPDFHGFFASQGVF